LSPVSQAEQHYNPSTARIVAKIWQLKGPHQPIESDQRFGILWFASFAASLLLLLLWL